MLSMTAVDYGYENHQVLKGFSLRLGQKQRLAIMGPSGIGKTTILRLALGLEQPIKGEICNEFQKIGVVFQEPRLLPWRSALENVNLVLGDGADTLDQAKDYLEKMGLEQAMKKYPDELSGGMQQRVSLARALALKGDLLVLDEPFKAMDEALKEQVISMVNEFQGAILLVTHEKKEAEALGCEILIVGEENHE